MYNRAKFENLVRPLLKKKNRETIITPSLLQEKNTTRLTVSSTSIYRSDKCTEASGREPSLFLLQYVLLSILFGTHNFAFSPFIFTGKHIYISSKQYYDFFLTTFTIFSILTSKLTILSLLVRGEDRTHKEDARLPCPFFFIFLNSKQFLIVQSLNSKRFFLKFQKLNNFELNLGYLRKS